MNGLFESKSLSLRVNQKKRLYLQAGCEGLINECH